MMIDDDDDDDNDDRGHFQSINQSITKWLWPVT